MCSLLGLRTILPLALLGALPVGVWGGDILTTSGYSTCINNPTVQVNKMNVVYDKDTRQISFDVAGVSTEPQRVMANLVVSAYGKQVYTNSFDPCDKNMTMMCPIPTGTFASAGEQQIPAQYASQIPSIAFSIPDLDGDVRLELKNVDNNQSVACISSQVTNGHTLSTPAISYVAIGIAGGALLLSGVSAAVSGGASSPSPTFGEVMGWFQGVAMNGMMSVQYPQVYQSFASNFAFSTGLIPWGSMQQTIDSFRQKTGGNLTDDNYPYLKNNATLVHRSGSGSNLAKRSLGKMLLLARDGTSVNVNGTSANIGDGAANNTTSSNSSGGSGKQPHFVSGIQAYVEQLTIPSGNTFITLLLIWAIVVAAIIVFILLLKLLLEAWATFGNIPKSMESWRKRYWSRLSKALTNLILMLYGVWTLYCIYQFTDGDSWAAKLLAAVTWAAFTAALAFFTWRIFSKAREYKKLEGDTSKLYEDKDTWVKYNNFYENYKKSYWWLFVPIVVYLFARGCIIAGGNGHGLVQAGGQLIVEAIMLAFLLWTRPFARASGNWINIVIHVVRVLSIICILIFVEELGINQTTKTITGVVLIVVQSVLTAVLAILIAVNALITCIRENPHRRQRKENEKLHHRDTLDNLTPLDARNSMLMEPMSQKGDGEYKPALAPLGNSAKGQYDRVPLRAESPAPPPVRSFSRPGRFDRDDEEDRDHLVAGAAGMGHRADESVSRSPPRDRGASRQPTLPDVYGRAF